MLGVLRESLRQSLLYVEMLQRLTPFPPLGLPQQWLQPFLPGIPPHPQPETPPPPAESAAVEGLLHRIGELERRLGDLDAPVREPPPKAASRKNKPGRGERRRVTAGRPQAVLGVECGGRRTPEPNQNACSPTWK